MFTVEINKNSPLRDFLYPVLNDNYGFQDKVFLYATLQISHRLRIKLTTVYTYNCSVQGESSNEYAIKIGAMCTTIASHIKKHISQFHKYRYIVSP